MSLHLCLAHLFGFIFGQHPLLEVALCISQLRNPPDGPVLGCVPTQPSKPRVLLAKGHLFSEVKFYNLNEEEWIWMSEMAVFLCSSIV